MELAMPELPHSVLGERLQSNNKEEAIELYYELLSSGHSVGEILNSLGRPQSKPQHGETATAEHPQSEFDGVATDVTSEAALVGAAQANMRRIPSLTASLESESCGIEKPRTTESAPLNEPRSADWEQLPGESLPGSEPNVVRSAAVHTADGSEIAVPSSNQEALQPSTFSNSAKRIAFAAIYTVAVASASIASFATMSGGRNADPTSPRTEVVAIPGLAADRSEMVVEIPKPNKQVVNAGISPASEPSRSAEPGSAVLGAPQRDTAEIPSTFSARTARIGQAAEPGRQAQASVISDRGAVRLVAGRSGDVAVQMAEEIAGIVDDGATPRVVPMVGNGSLQNIADLKYRRGVDLAIVPTDALEHAREQRLLPGIEDSLGYIAKLYNQELHLLARRDINKVADLYGKTVNVDAQGSSTAFTTTRLFNLLRIKTKIAYDNQDAALQKLRNGEIAALAFVAPKPAPFFQTLDATNGLHLLSIPLTPAVAGAYDRSRITAADYPRLVTSEEPADTIAVGTVLIAADLRILSDRYRNIEDVVDALFTNFRRLLAPGHHPKWREVNIAAEFPGWARHPEARQWLRQNARIAASSLPEPIKVLSPHLMERHR